MTPLLFVAFWLALNVLVTRRLWLLRHRLHATGMRIAMVWLVPFIGAGISLLDTVSAKRQLAAEQAPVRVWAHEPAPDEVPGVGVGSFPLRSHLIIAHGFALVDWSAAEDWLSTIANANDRDSARLDLHRAWLEHLRESLGETFWLHESDDALIVSSLDPALVAAMSRFVATTRQRVPLTLGALASFPPQLKSVVLVMDNEDAYYAYSSLYGAADGEQALSGGCFINAACPHFVVRRADLSVIEPVIAHELTHSALTHLRLPLWLDEGLAVNTEQRIVGARQGLYTPRELRQKHVAFWNDASIQQFWTGASFHRPDDGNLLSYDLARILVAQMSHAWPAFERFVLAAEREDAGAASARAHLSFDLGAYVRLVCEREPDGSWQPTVAVSPDDIVPAQASDTA
ncbi:hypothetical protein [Niveibacterium sp. SC-1]|uniref:hypothetical protein n=1 Tax=Niveibacterium sp. SC-1 TaxID=3135646 RepID=UPI00311E15B0